MWIYTDGSQWIGTNDGDVVDIGDAIAAWAYKRDIWDERDHVIFSEILYRLLNMKDIFKTHVEHLTKRMLEYYGYRWKLNPTMHPKYIRNGELNKRTGVIHNKLEIINHRLAYHGWTVNIEEIVDDTVIPIPRLKWVRAIGSVVDPMKITGKEDALNTGRSILARMKAKRIEKGYIDA